MQFLNIYFVSIYHLPFDIVKCFPPKLCFSFSLGENLISQKLNQKENNYPIITKYTLQFRLPRLWIHSSGRLVGKIISASLVLPIPPKFFLTTPGHIKGVSEQHKESVCLLQQPEEEGHSIRSQEPFRAP